MDMRYDSSHMTSHIIFKSSEQEVVGAFKSAIERSDTAALQDMHSDILGLAAAVYQQSPHAAMCIYSKLGSAYNALPRHSAAQYSMAMECLHAARQLAIRQNDTLSQAAISYELGLAHEALDATCT